MQDKFNVFVYGTLMFEDTFRAITGFEEDIDCHLAVLKGFERRSVPHGGYPAIFHNDDNKVQGILVRDVPSECLPRLDRYEGEGSLYLRKEVSVTVPESLEAEAGEEVKAWVYVWPHGPKTLANGDWEYDAKEVMAK